jgi:ABC-type polar amino acid transport system ATPase subunit
MQSIAEMLCSSYEMKKILEVSKKLAKMQVPILIIGELGTGRKSLARIIHEFSPNKERQFFEGEDVEGGDVVESFHLIPLSYQARPLKKHQTIRPFLTPRRKGRKG